MWCSRSMRKRFATSGYFVHGAPPPVARLRPLGELRRARADIRSAAPEVIVAPYLVVVVTDARHYRDLSGSVFRFIPARLTSRDLERVHATNERIGVRDYGRAVRFYRQLILSAAGGSTNSTGASWPTSPGNRSSQL